MPSSGSGCSTSRKHVNPSVAATAALAGLGLNASPESVRWLDPPHASGIGIGGTSRFATLAHRQNEPSDVWLGEARISPEGRFIRLSSLYNLSDSSAVSESALTVSGARLAWVVNDGREASAIRLVDLKGRTLPSEWTWLERWQTRITFLQETGQLRGLCERAYRFDAPRAQVSLAFAADGLKVESQGRNAILRCDGLPSQEQELGLTAEPSELGSPGDLVTWTVDRVRALPWFGSDRMQWLKAVAFNVVDHLDSFKQRVAPSDGSAQLAREVGDFLSHAPSSTQNPETGWPPAPMTPILSPALPQEGVFRPLDNDPFATSRLRDTSAFAFAFVRPDPSRPESQVFVVLWDPRLVELHTMTGTREPKTATGETGPGMVPRDDATIGSLAAAFNGGFQATHGEFGMMAQRIVYLPPKPYAATIAEMADGSVGFGTWPDDESIPSTMIGFRQNLTPLVADGLVNPYQRTWWGGVPPGWQDATRTVRTGLCLTREHFVAYFYGSSISADHLAKAMVSARCSYGVHLDMNPGHTGFEFYRVQKSGTLPDVEHKLDANWETRGTVPGTSGWEFLGRRMLKTMHLMHFPRYIRTDSRDFFYLTYRHVLPPTAPAANGGDRSQEPWQVDTHEQHGYPPAIATRRTRPDPAHPELEVAIVVLDGKWLDTCTSNCPQTSLVARVDRPIGGKGRGVYFASRRFLSSDEAPSSDAVPIAFGKTETNVTRAAAALGVFRNEWLIYAEITRGGGDRTRDRDVLGKVLEQQGCADPTYFEQPLGFVIGSHSGASITRGDLGFVRAATPSADRILAQTPVVPPTTWQPLQAKRVRYIRQRAPAPNPRPATPSDVDASEELEAPPEP